MGPGVGVVFREPWDDAAIDALDVWLRAIDPGLTDPRQAARRFERVPMLEVQAVWDVEVVHSAPLGLGPGDWASCCGVSVGLEAPTIEEETRDQWLAQVGFVPRQEVGMAANCKKDIDHRVLGHMALGFAERFGGIINLHGAWCPPMDLEWVPDEDLGGLWKKPATPFRYTGPGRIYEIHYTTGRGTPWYYNLADVEAFRARLADEHFWLIK